jgi:ABC-type branched-subunit amino acid transport system substrate-binding protein
MTIRGSHISRRTLLTAWLPLGLLAQYVDKRQTPLEYEGPGREDPEPTEFTEIPIGFFGPDDPAHPQGGAIYMGAALAFEDANARGGYKNKPFRLVARWSDDPWRGGASAVAKLVFIDRVWAVLGGIDGATTHLAEQVIVKARLPLVDPASTDQTVNQVNVPWMFSLAPGDPEIARFLAARLGHSPFVLFATTDHDSRNLATELLKTGVRPAFRHDIAPGTASVPDAPPEAAFAVILAPPRETQVILAALPPGIHALAGPSARARSFSAARPIQAPTLRQPDPALLARLAQRFQQPADDFSLLAYDAATLLVQAVRDAGLNKALIRDRLAIQFGPRGRQLHEVLL